MPSTHASSPRDEALDHHDGGRWEFDQGVTDVFDDMLARSIPQYAEMRRLVTGVARAYLPEGGHVTDIGASRGEALAQVLPGRQCSATAIEVSEPMLAALRERFSGDPRVVVDSGDLRDAKPLPESDVVLSVLTLIFVPIEHRQQLIRRVFAALRPGGVLVLVEKVLGADAGVDDLLVDLHHRDKVAAGYPEEAVIRKRAALQGVLVPLTARWNEDMLARAGFETVDCFWRSLNFAAWVAVKGRR